MKCIMYSKINLYLKRVAQIIIILINAKLWTYNKKYNVV